MRFHSEWLSHKSTIDKEKFKGIKAFCFCCKGAAPRQGLLSQTTAVGHQGETWLWVPTGPTAVSWVPAGMPWSKFTPEDFILFCLQ